MSQHRQDIPTEPSRWWIVLYSLAGVVALWVVLATIAAETWTWVHLAAVLFGLFTAAVFAALSGHKVLQRGEARLALIRRQEREDRRAAAEHAERVRQTGTWRGDLVGEVLAVRWDPATRTYWVQGWLSDHWQQREERPWADLETLAATLTELERSGELSPVDDEGTRAVRARLDLPGWDGADPDPVVTQPDPEDTGVITYTDTGLPRRPVGETLRPIDTARFRD
jgi:hypothetical protein